LVKELDQAAQVNVHWKKVGQASQVTALRFNKVPIMASEANKIRKSYKEKKKRQYVATKAVRGSIFY
jgi:hypothetical protein